MQNRRPRDSQPAPLREMDAERLLARAAELDAAATAGASLAELRAAAGEAGISARAFDAALAELRSGERAPVAGSAERPRVRRAPRRTRAVAAIALIAAGALAVSRARTPTPVPAASDLPVVEEALLLRCLTPDDAAALVRPLLDLPANTIVVRPVQAPHVLTVRATPAQLERVRRVLEESEARSPACARR